jgi:hypothetical protein
MCEGLRVRRHSVHSLQRALYPKLGVDSRMRDADVLVRRHLFGHQRSQKIKVTLPVSLLKSAQRYLGSQPTTVTSQVLCFRGQRTFSDPPCRGDHRPASLLQNNAILSPLGPPPAICSRSRPPNTFGQQNRVGRAAARRERRCYP